MAIRNSVEDIKDYDSEERAAELDLQNYRNSLVEKKKAAAKAAWMKKRELERKQILDRMEELEEEEAVASDNVQGNAEPADNSQDNTPNSGTTGSNDDPLPNRAAPIESKAQFDYFQKELHELKEVTRALLEERIAAKSPSANFHRFNEEGFRFEDLENAGLKIVPTWEGALDMHHEGLPDFARAHKRYKDIRLPSSFNLNLPAGKTGGELTDAKLMWTNFTTIIRILKSKEVLSTTDVDILGLILNVCGILSQRRDKALIAANLDNDTAKSFEGLVKSGPLMNPKNLLYLQQAINLQEAKARITPVTNPRQQSFPKQQENNSNHYAGNNRNRQNHRANNNNYNNNSSNNSNYNNNRRGNQIQNAINNHAQQQPAPAAQGLANN